MTKRTSKDRWQPAWLALSVAVSLSLSACASAPPVSYQSTRGDIRAHDLASAEQTGAWLDDLQPVLESWIPDARTGRRFEVWRMADHEWPGPGILREQHPRYGLCLSESGQIRIRDQLTIPHMEEIARAPEWRLRTKAVLAHELVHGLLGDSWRGLPLVVEEGLADYLAARAVPELAGAERTTGALPLLLFATDEPVRVFATASAGGHVGAASATFIRPDPLPSPDAFLSVGTRTSQRWSHEAERAGRALGFTIVDRITQRGGIERLNELASAGCDSAEGITSLDALLDAAGIDTLDTNTFVRLARGLLDEPDAPRWLGLAFAEILDDAQEDLRQSLASAGVPETPATLRLELRAGTRISAGRFVVP